MREIGLLLPSGERVGVNLGHDPLGLAGAQVVTVGWQRVPLVKGQRLAKNQPPGTKFGREKAQDISARFHVSHGTRFPPPGILKMAVRCHQLLTLLARRLEGSVLAS